MKNFTLILVLLLASASKLFSQCTTSNATTCVCATSGVTNCDLLPDMMVARPPLLPGSGGVVEYSQVGNGTNDGLLRITVSTPNIGLGPLEVRGTNVFVCGTDTIVGTAPTTCPTTGLPPKQLLNQRVYHKNGAVMSFYDRAAGTMTYHPSHGHQHVDDWGMYTLRTATTDPNPLNWPIIGTGAKLSFCLLDLSNCTSSNGHCVDSLGNVLTGSNMPNYGLGGGAYGCSQTLQGISAGYVDIYSQSLDGMFITVPPGTCNGQYYIVVQLDPNNNFIESDENNNVISVPVTLTKQSGTVPTISVTGSTSLCPGNTVTLTSSPAPSYLWSNGSTTQSITVGVAGNYTVTTDVGSACSGVSQPISVTVQNMPVTVTPVSGNLCPGQSTTLNTVVTTPPNGTVQTSFTSSTVYNIPDNDAAGVASPLIVSGINPTTLASGAIYSVQINITHTYTGDLVVALIAPSGNTINLSNRRGGGGDNFSNTIFSMTAGTAIASGNAPFNGSYVPDGSFNSLTGSANGTWQLKVTDLAGVDVGTINSWTLTMNNVVTTQLIYSWSSVPAGFSSTAANPVVNPSGNTTYTVVATNTITGCSGTNSAVVNVNPVNLNVSSNTAICEGGTATLTASGANSYVWSPATGLSATNVASVNANPATTTTYTVTGTNSFGCTASQNVTVTVNNNPVITASANTSICAGNTAALTASGASTYVWSPATGLSSTTGASVNASPASTTTYTVTGTNSFGCTSSQNVTVTVNPLPTVTLANFAAVCHNTASFVLTGGAPLGGTYSGPGVTAGSFSAAAAGIGTHTITYTYTDNNTGCTHAASKTIVVNNCNCVTPSVPSSITGLTPVCAGAAVVYSVTNVATVTSYNWVAPANATIIAGQGTNSVTVQFGANYTTGSLCVAAVNACGGSLPRCKTITKKASSTPGNILGQLSGHCETVVNLSVNPVSGAQSYNWTLPANTSLISGQGTNNISFSTLPGFVSGSVCVTQFNGCVNSTARCATIYSAPAKPVISGPATVCAGQTNLTYSIPASYGATTYTWTVPAGSTIVSGQGTTSIVVNFGSTAGKVTVIAKNACGNRGTSTFNVAINCRVSDANYNAFDLSVSPNPASSSTEVRISGNTGEKATLTVTNVLGKDVYTETKTLNSEKLFTLDLTGFSKGIYMVSVSSGNNRKAVRLVVD